MFFNYISFFALFSSIILFIHNKLVLNLHAHLPEELFVLTNVITEISKQMGLDFQNQHIVSIPFNNTVRSVVRQYISLHFILLILIDKANFKSHFSSLYREYLL